MKLFNFPRVSKCRILGFVACVALCLSGRVWAADQFELINATVSKLTDYSLTKPQMSTNVLNGIKQLTSLRDAAAAADQQLPLEYIQPFSDFLTNYDAASHSAKIESEDHLVDEVLKDIACKAATRDASGADIFDAVPVEILVTVITKHNGKEVGGYSVRANTGRHGVDLPAEYLWSESDPLNHPKKKVILGDKNFFVLVNGRLVANQPESIGGDRSQIVTININ